VPLELGVKRRADGVAFALGVALGSGSFGCGAMQGSGAEDEVKEAPCSVVRRRPNAPDGFVGQPYGAPPA
jgi:hypothetical protein